MDLVVEHLDDKMVEICFIVVPVTHAHVFD